MNRAVDVAKEAADIVLLEKDLNALVQGILEDRHPLSSMAASGKQNALRFRFRNQDHFFDIAIGRIYDNLKRKEED